VLLVGIEGRERVITHTIDFPLDGAIVFGAGAGLVSGGSTLFVPVGLSLGRASIRRIDDSASCPTCSPPCFVAGTGSHSGPGVRSWGRRRLPALALLDARCVGRPGDPPVTGVSTGAVWCTETGTL